MIHLKVIHPEAVEKGGVYKFSDEIIDELRTEDELFVVGFGNAISMTCMAVQRSTNLAKVVVNEISLDYFGSPKLGLGIVFFDLKKESAKEWDKKKNELEQNMKLTFDRDGQLVVISKKLLPEKAIPLCLSKIAQTDLLKISATGANINRASLIALELTKGNIAKDILGIELIFLSTVKIASQPVDILETAIDIYIKKGVKTAYSGKHREALKMLENW